MSLDPATRKHARRVFEESLASFLATYAPEHDMMLEAQALDDAGRNVVVARYKLYVDGRVECFEVLDDVFWPALEG